MMALTGLTHPHTQALLELGMRHVAVQGGCRHVQGIWHSSRSNSNLSV
jgi:hypothetical protein